MTSTPRKGEPLTPYDPEFGRTMHTMNNQRVSIASNEEGLDGGEGMKSP